MANLNELKPEDVMRALECHSLADISTCDDCPYCDISEQGNCGCDMARDALTLLREKDKEIERLTKERDLANAEREANVNGFTAEIARMAQELLDYRADAQGDIADLNATIESLRNEIKACHEALGGHSDPVGENGQQPVLFAQEVQNA